MLAPELLAKGLAPGCAIYTHDELHDLVAYEERPLHEAMKLDKTQVLRHGAAARCRGTGRGAEGAEVLRISQDSAGTVRCSVRGQAVRRHRLASRVDGCIDFRKQN